jgi:hypothetical protein
LSEVGTKVRYACGDILFHGRPSFYCKPHHDDGDCGDEDEDEEEEDDDVGEEFLEMMLLGLGSGEIIHGTECACGLVMLMASHSYLLRASLDAGEGQRRASERWRSSCDGGSTSSRS